MKHVMMIALAAGLLLTGGCFQDANYDASLSLRRELAQRDQVIQEQEQSLTDKDVELCRRDEVIDDLASQIEKLRAELAKAPVSRTVIVKQEVEKPRIEEKGVDVETRGDDIVITVAGDVLFPTGQWAIDKNAEATLAKVALAIKNHYSDRVIRIEGHTDNVPVRANSKTGLRDNFDLSFRRADAVRQYMKTQQWSDEKIYIAAYGETRPRDPNKTDAGKARNRRVEIVILPKLDLRVKELASAEMQ
jgi:chemotaxis protein MotB